MKIAIWCGVILLVAIGVSASILRAVIIRNPPVGHDVNGIEQQLLEQFHPGDPFNAQLLREYEEVDRRFATRPSLTLLHVVPGGLFLALAPLQFVPAIRRRFITFHRWSGRLLVVLAILSVVPAFYFGVAIPYGGTSEATAIAVFGSLFVLAILRAFVAIRNGDVRCHREWMIRAFALALAISTIRLLGIAVQAFTRAPVHEQLGVVFWTGWALMLGAAELWVRHTRPRVVTTPAAVSV